MFTEYFANSARELQDSLSRNLEKRGVVLPGKEKDLKIYKEMFGFLQEHLPDRYSLAMGKVRGKKHILNRNCDLLIYQKWCSKLLNMSGGYVPIDTLNSFISLETDLSTESLLTHIALTNALKSLYQSAFELEEDRIVPVFSLILTYKSSVPLMSHKVAIKDASREKGISLNNELDMICVLNEGLIIKDWENGGEYKVVETGQDTLMWFYILLLEYLDRNGDLGVNPRAYIKNVREYKEY